MAVPGQKRLLGIWDLRSSPLSIGGVLVFLEELQILCTQQHAETVDFCIVSDLLDGQKVTTKSAMQRYQEQSRVIGTLMLPPSIQGIGDCYWFESENSLRLHLSRTDCEYQVWPESAFDNNLVYPYSDTTFTQNYFRQKGSIPYLSFTEEHQLWAQKFIMEHVHPYLPIVVYLKNNPQMPGCSNADFQEWLLFFQAHHKYDVRFIIIGNDDFDEALRQIENVIIARDYDSFLVRDLALVQEAYFFMGMASGPTMAAVYSETPYIIFKNPGHDVAQMEHELGDKNHFSFATLLQKLLRQNDTEETITEQFINLYTRYSRKEWEHRMLTWKV